MRENKMFTLAQLLSLTLILEVVFIIFSPTHTSDTEFSFRLLQWTIIVSELVLDS